MVWAFLALDIGAAPSEAVTATPWLPIPARLSRTHLIASWCISTLDDDILLHNPSTPGSVIGSVPLGCSHMDTTTCRVPLVLRYKCERLSSFPLVHSKLADLLSFPLLVVPCLSLPQLLEGPLLHVCSHLQLFWVSLLH